MSKNKVTKEINIPIDPTKKYYVVYWSDNWADEMDLEGWVTMSEDQLEEWKSSIPKKSFTYGVGTNEEIEYDNRADFLRRVHQTPITHDELATLINLFNQPVIKYGKYLQDVREFESITTIESAGSGYFPTFDDYEDGEDE